MCQKEKGVHEALKCGKNGNGMLSYVIELDALESEFFLKSICESPIYL